MFTTSPTVPIAASFDAVPAIIFAAAIAPLPAGIVAPPAPKNKKGACNGSCAITPISLTTCPANPVNVPERLLTSLAFLASSNALRFTSSCCSAVVFKLPTSIPWLRCCKIKASKVSLSKIASVSDKTG